MTDPNIATPQHLLKRLEHEMNFLGSLMNQAQYVAHNLVGTWGDIQRAHEKWEKEIEKR